MAATSDRDYNSEEDNAASARACTSEIRIHMSSTSQERWGLPIIRCTYASQEWWDAFLLQMMLDIEEEYLRYESRDVLRKSLQCPVVEDRARLDGATWEQARTKFDEWIVEDMAAHPLEDPPKTIPTRVFNKPEERAAFDIMRSPYWSFCIFVDEASLSSVLDTTTPKDERSISEGKDYYFILVPSTFRWEDSQVYDLDGRRYEDDGMDEYK